MFNYAFSESAVIPSGLANKDISIVPIFEEVESGDRAVERQPIIRGKVFQSLQALSFISHCLSLSEETLKPDGPFYLVSMAGE